MTAQTSQAALALKTPEVIWSPPVGVHDVVDGGNEALGVGVLDDRVTAVGLVGGDGVGLGGLGGGEERVEPPGLEQRPLPVAGLGGQVGDETHDQPPGDLVSRVGSDFLVDV